MNGFDTTRDVTPILGQLKSEGYQIVGRYYSRPSITWKTIKRPEADALAAAGLKIWVVYQEANNAVRYFDDAQGRVAAHNALKYAQDVIGQPKGSAIYFAVDYDASQADVDGPIRDYFLAVSEEFTVAGSAYKIGVYGSGRVCGSLLDGKLAELAWLSQSTGHAGYQKFYASKRWALAQKPPSQKFSGDPNEVSTSIDPGFFVPGTAVSAPSQPSVPLLAVATAPSRINSASLAYPGAPLAVGFYDSPLVNAVQQQLKASGIKIVPDGDFGQETQDGVMLFQARHTDLAGNPLDISGTIDEETWNVLFHRVAGGYDRASYNSGVDERTLILEVARSQIGVREQPIGSNRGPEVDEYIRATGLNPEGHSYAWCVCFMQWVFNEVAAIRGGTNPLPRTAGVLALWNMKNKGATDVIYARDAKDDFIKPGMLFLISTGGGNGHAGIVESVQGGKLSTIEGNTNDGGSREGYGVFNRTNRAVKMGGLLGYLDFC